MIFQSLKGEARTGVRQYVQGTGTVKLLRRKAILERWEEYLVDARTIS
jgi:hypothetical protein